MPEGIESSPPIQPMTPERKLEGVSQIERGQVVRAIEEVQKTREREASGAKYPWLPESAEIVILQGEKLSPEVEAVKRVVALVPHGEIDEGVMPDLSREIRPEDRRSMLERERQLEYSRRSWVSEQLESPDPQIVKETIRDFMASVESEPEFPDTQRLDIYRHQINERAKLLENALDPESARRLDLGKFGLVEKIQMVPVLRSTPEGNFEIELSTREARVVNEVADKFSLGKLAYEIEKEPEVEVREQRFVAVLDSKDIKYLRRDGDVRKILDRVESVIKPPSYSPEQMKKLAEACANSSREMWVREKIFIAYIYYTRASSSVDAISNLMTNGAYSLIPTSEWRDLFSLDETVESEEERRFGDKIDMAMRIYALLGAGGGTDADSEGNSPERQLREALKKQPENVRQIIEREKGAFDEHVKKNIFCQGQKGEGSTKTVDEIRKWVKSKLGKDKDDNNAAEEWAWKIFQMWGLANSFDNRYSKDGINTEPLGSYPTDDAVKIYHFESYRSKESRRGYKGGPDATREKYPKNLVTDFMKMEGDGVLWKEWWEQGKLLKDLSWENLGEAAWWHYTYVLWNAGRKETGLLDRLNQGFWKRENLINTETLRELNKTIDKVVGPWMKDGTGNMWCGSEDAAKKRIRELILIGAITQAYTNSNNAWQEWGLWRPTGYWEKKVWIGPTNEQMAATEVLKREIQEIINRSGFGASWNDVVKEAEKFPRIQV